MKGRLGEVNIGTSAGGGGGAALRFRTAYRPAGSAADHRHAGGPVSFTIKWAGVRAADNVEVKGGFSQVSQATFNFQNVP